MTKQDAFQLFSAAPYPVFFIWLLLLAGCTPATISSDSPQPASPQVAVTGTPTMVATTPAIEPSSTPAFDSASDFDCARVDQIPANECTTLVALYQATNGLHWLENDGWLANDTPCSWSGIVCEGGFISQITLYYNELAGPLPAELGNLSHLKALALQGNRLSGAIPSELVNLTELVTLDLASNQLSGSIPGELGDLGGLQTLSLADNQLRGAIPAPLGKLRQLTSLNLSRNQLNGSIPGELGDLARLTSLYLSHNQLSGSIPSSFARLDPFIELNVSYNQLSGQVPENLIQVDQRRLWGNQLDGTVTTAGQGPLTVDYRGVQLTADPALATSIWPEALAAGPSSEEGPFWTAAPERLRFTFANPQVSLERRRMGINLAAEGQILVYPLAELTATSPNTQQQIESLEGLLADQGPLPAGEWPLLPLNNATQAFHAQARFFDLGDIQGLRFISQPSQEALPVLLSSELFYTFQGMTHDGRYYVAAFFPLWTELLPESIEIDDWDAFVAGYDAYLAETAAALDQLPPAGFAPDLSLLDEVIASLRLDPAGILFVDQ